MNTKSIVKVLHVNLAKGFRGGERQTEILIRELAKSNNIRQALVCRSDSPLRTRLADVPNLGFVKANHQLQGHFSAPESDLVHAHEAKAVHWAWLHKTMKGAPYILTRRVPYPVKDKFFNRLAYCNASLAVAISSSIKKHLDSLGWTKTALVASVLARLTQDNEKIIRLQKQKQAKIIVGHIGALVDRHKGQSVLLQVARMMQEEHPEVEFWFLGQGEDEAWLKQQSLELHNVKWLGFQSDVGSHLTVMDVFAFPSRNEGLGSVLLDVMDAGVPIVASDVDGIPDIVQHEQTGLLVPAGDAASLHKSLLRLLGDKSLSDYLVKNAKGQLDNYTPERMAESYKQIYCEVIGLN